MLETSQSAGIIERMKLALNAPTVRALAVALGVSPSSIGNWRSRGTIPVSECMQIAETQNVSLDWLLLGRGQSRFVPDSSPAPAVREIPGEIPASLLDAQGYAGIPLYDIDAAAGHGAELTSEVIETIIYFSRKLLREESLDPAQTIGARVRGSSMEPTLFDGQCVIVDCSKKNPDGVFLFRRDCDLFIKRIQRLPGNAWNLISDNRMYDPVMIDPINVQRIEIIGRIDLAIGRIL